MMDLQVRKQTRSKQPSMLRVIEERMKRQAEEAEAAQRRATAGPPPLSEEEKAEAEVCCKRLDMER